MNYKQAGNIKSGYGGCLLIPFFILWSIFAAGQQTTKVVVPPSKDTTVINFTTTTTTTSNTVTTYTTSTKPTDSVVITPPPVDTSGVPSGYSLVYSTSYDNDSDLDPCDHGQYGNGYIAKDGNTHSGIGCFRSVPKSGVSAGDRSEVQYNFPNDNCVATPKEGIVDYWVLYEVFAANSMHSIQFHPRTGGGSGTGLYHKNGLLQFVTVKSGTSGTNVGTPFSISTGTWHHIVLTYKFGISGYIKVEVDGAVKVNANVQMGDGSDPYLKVGQNMWASQTAIARYDDLKIYKKN